MNQISYNDIQLLKRSVGDEGGVLTMGIVSDKVDTFNTWLNPEGNDTPAQTIIIDFNHQNEPTGAKMLRTYIGYVQTNQDGTFDIQEVATENYIKTLIGEIFVPKTARMPVKTSNGEVKSLGNLYEEVKDGIVAWGSLQFDATPYPEETKTDKNGRIYYGKYRILYYSLLNKAPSQDMSFKLKQENFRMAEKNNKDSETSQNTNTMSFKQHDLAKHTNQEGKEHLVRISRLEENEEKEKSYECQSLDGKEYRATDGELSEPSNDEAKDYIRALHKKLDTSDSKAEQKENGENDQSEPEKTRSEAENDDIEADTELFKELIKPLAEQLTALATKLDEFIQKDKKEDENETRSYQNNPALIPIDPIESSESRGVTNPAHLSNSNLSEEERMKQYKLTKQYYK